MKKEGVFHSLLWLVVFAVGVFLCACNGHEEIGNNVIVQNEVFTVTGDSIIEDTVVACVSRKGDHIRTNISTARLDSLYRHNDLSDVDFVQGKVWQKRMNRPAGMPQYSSEQPLVDALYDMSAERIVDAIDNNGRFNVTHNISRLYCSIYLSLAYLKPHQSMATLKSLVDVDSIIMQREGQWPVVSDHIGWATAAWEVYKATGDRAWLTYCRRVIEKTLSINSEVLVDHPTGLIHGAGYTTSKPLGVRRMTWMGYNDLFACMSLGNNILTAHAYAILNDMCDELGIENTYDKDAQRLKDAINQHLWSEEKGFYCSFLYGMAFPKQSPTTDNTSQAMCVLWGIADDDRAENLIANTPVSDKGINVTYPANNPLEPYFANSSWATTQALWNMAAAYTGNVNALRHGLGALYRAQALYQSHGIRLRDIPIDELGTSASNAAMIMRALLGMNFKPEGIEFEPIIPNGMIGKKTFSGLTYRKAVLDITIDGTGNDIASFSVNGKEQESAFLPKDIEGHHHIVITLKGGKRHSQKVTIHHDELILPLTPTVVWSNDTGYIADFVPGTPYRLSVNGEITSLNDSVFVLPNTEGFTEFSVEIAGKYTSGFMSKPLFRYYLTPQIAFFPKTETDTTAINVIVAQGGDYLMDIGYRPTGTLDVRKVAANGHPMGTLVMASGNTQGEDDLAYSNMVKIKLLKGNNVITISQLRLPKSFTPCEPVHVRIISY